MKKTFILAAALSGLASVANCQTLSTRDFNLDKVFDIATSTLYRNVKDSVLLAGGAYGGEWTRDIAINAWNAANILMPEIARYSLWNVTTDHRTNIGHQYWDQIIWVIGAFDHYLVTGDKDFLYQAYVASRNTMRKLELEAFDKEYGLFTGPSVFNDGISGYDEPVFAEGNRSSNVLDYPNSSSIKCLSTNCVYYKAYQILSKMAELEHDIETSQLYADKAEYLKNNIRRHFYDSVNDKLSYMIDGECNIHDYQEGLGLSFAILFDILDKEEGWRVVDRAYVGPYGFPSIYPSFKRFSKEKPGRHNVMIWPFVNAFWAEACLHVGREDKFVAELENIRNLVIDSNEHFYEVYDVYTGKVNGGWQTGKRSEWDSVEDQTWSATGYIRMILRGLLGMDFTEEGITFSPNAYLLNRYDFLRLSGLRFQDGQLEIAKVGKGNEITNIIINGESFEPGEAIVRTPHTGRTVVEIMMK